MATIEPASVDKPYDPSKDKELDPYEYKDKKAFSKIRRALWFCAGADIELLQHCPHSERVKEEGIGGIVLATAVLAFVSGSYAMYCVFKEKTGHAFSAAQQSTDWVALPIALVIGLIWSLVIFNLDRFIVSSGGHGDGTDAITPSEFLKALPRLVMAAIIGLTLSKPLEIRIMESEINAKLTAVQRDFADTEKGKLAKEHNESKVRRHFGRLSNDGDVGIDQMIAFFLHNLVNMA